MISIEFHVVMADKRWASM